MLRYLSIRRLAVIDSVDVEFDPIGDVIRLGTAPRLKSVTLTRGTALCEREPETAVRVNV